MNIQAESGLFLGPYFVFFVWQEVSFGFTVYVLVKSF